MCTAGIAVYCLQLRLPASLWVRFRLSFPYGITAKCGESMCWVCPAHARLVIVCNPKQTDTVVSDMSLQAAYCLPLQSYIHIHWTMIALGCQFVVRLGLMIIGRLRIALRHGIAAAAIIVRIVSRCLAASTLSRPETNTGNLHQKRHSSDERYLYPSVRNSGIAVILASAHPLCRLGPSFRFAVTRMCWLTLIIRIMLVETLAGG